MKIAKTGREFALLHEGYRTLELTLVMFYWVLGWFVVSVVPFMRKDFGERYLSWINLLFGYTVTGTFCGALGWYVAKSQGANLSWVLPIFYFGFIAASIYHRRVITRKNNSGLAWHTYYSGTPLAEDFVPLSREAINMWLEPLGLMAVGLLFVKLVAPLGWWLLIAGFALLVHEHISYHLQRERVLDTRDARIEASVMQDVLTGKRPQQTKGFVLAESNIRLINSMPEVRNVFLGIDPELKAVLDKEVAA